MGQIVVLRGFDEIDELQQERRRALMSGGPFNIGGDHVGLSMETYELFPFLPEIEPSTRGRFEFRRYWLMPAGIAPTIAAWEQAVGPAEAYVASRRQHVRDRWPASHCPYLGFSSLEERMALRARHYAEGLWPPRADRSRSSGLRRRFACRRRGLRWVELR